MGSEMCIRDRDDALRFESLSEFEIDRAGMDFAVHLAFAHLAGDVLGVLRPKIENKDFLIVDVFRGAHRGNFSLFNGTTSLVQEEGLYYNSLPYQEPVLSLPKGSG